MGNNTDHDIVELRGSSISYFTGKMENYFRLKGIPYRLESMVFPGEEERNKKVLGLSQMPTVRLPDGRRPDRSGSGTRCAVRRFALSQGCLKNFSI